MAEQRVRTGEPIRLTDLLTNREDSIIEGYTFENCELYGPAVVVLQNGIEFSGTTFMLPDGGSFESILFELASGSGQKVGIVALRNCRFLNCKIDNIGFVGTGKTLAPLRAAFGRGA